MLKLLAFLWTGCWHKWKFTGGHSEVYESLQAEARGLRAYTKYRYRCERCGIIREFRA